MILSLMSLLSKKWKDTFKMHLSVFLLEMISSTLLKKRKEKKTKSQHSLNGNPRAVSQ
jgi:hypothetical protein